jgi:trimeric autotransporter adhesin
MNRKGNPTRRSVWLLIAIIALLINPAVAQTAKWKTFGSVPFGCASAFSGSFNAVAELSDSSIVAAGDISLCDGVVVNRIARYNPQTARWMPLGSGLDSEPVALAVLNDEVYAAGRFTLGDDTHYLMRWNGTSWLPVQLPTPGYVTAMARYGDAVIVTVATAIPEESRIVSVQSGTATLLDDVVLGGVSELVASGTDLYAAGSFTQIGKVTSKNIARWNGISWNAVGTSANPERIGGLAVLDGQVFVSYDGITSNRMRFVSRIDASGTTVIGEFTSSVRFGVASIAAWNGRLYAGGAFTDVNGRALASVASWSQNTGWQSLGTGISSRAEMLFASQNGVWVAGQFARAGGVPANSIARWNEGWHVTGSDTGRGLRGQVQRVVEYGGKTIVVGAFNQAGALPITSIAYLENDNWRAFEQPVNGEIYDALVWRGDLYVTGRFTASDSTPLNNVARWDGSSWHSLASGLNGEGITLISDANALYVGGAFTQADGQAASGVASWDGTAWTSFGTDLQGTVLALTRFQGELVAGGSFPGRLAWWVNGKWVARLAVNNSVRALAASDTNLFVGGSFTAVNFLPNTSHLIRWNPTENVVPMGTFSFPNPDLAVRALSWNDNALVAGGAFIVMQDVDASLARWDGLRLRTLRRGVIGAASSITPYRNNLIIGGIFNKVDTQFSSGIAELINNGALFDNGFE